MTQKDKYDKIIMDSFLLEPGSVAQASAKTIRGWDSMGKLNLVMALEDEFNIELSAEEIMDLDSYDSGKEILIKHGIDI